MAEVSKDTSDRTFCEQVAAKFGDFMRGLFAIPINMYFYCCVYPCFRDFDDLKEKMVRGEDTTKDKIVQLHTKVDKVSETITTMNDRFEKFITNTGVEVVPAVVRRNATNGTHPASSPVVMDP